MNGCTFPEIIVELIELPQHSAEGVKNLSCAVASIFENVADPKPIQTGKVLNVER